MFIGSNAGRIKLKLKPKVIIRNDASRHFPLSTPEILNRDSESIPRGMPRRDFNPVS